MTQTSLATELGIAQQTIAHYEVGPLACLRYLWKS